MKGIVVKHKTKITERDIYKFVFSPESLDLEKRTYLESNRERFMKEMEFCQELKNTSPSLETEELVEIIIGKIGSIKVAELLPGIISSEAHDSKLRLAADSLNLNKKTYSSSFADQSSDHIVKIINNDSQTLLYLFSSDPISKARITFFPSETSYIIKDTSKPIEILNESIIQRVTVEKL